MPPYTNKVFFGIISIGLYWVFLHLAGLDDRLLQQIVSGSPTDAAQPIMASLDDYILTEHREIPRIVDNLSGITYSHRDRTLFAVTNQPPRVYVLTPSGVCLREIELIGFEDTEGIVSIGDGRFAIVEERRRTLAIVAIDGNSNGVHRREALQLMQLDTGASDNKGLEGIAFDRLQGCLYVAKEKRPRSLRAFYTPIGQQASCEIRVKNALLPSRWLMQDLSGLHFDSASRHLLLLSDESKCVLAIALDGGLQGYASLRKGFGGLKEDIPQPEGLTTDDDGNLYIVSEPNLFYRFTRRAGTAGRGLI